jgi:predicted acylesterase/phospholipase RssA
MPKRFQILSLSGGGYRGLHVARILELLEAQSKPPIARHFDLIAGTSIGGIIALALALEIPAKDIRETLEKVGPMLFPKAPPMFTKAKLVAAQPGKLGKIRFLLKHYEEIQAEWNAAKSAWYDPTPLREALEATRYFGDKKIGDLLYPVIVPAVNYSNGLPKFFKTNHHSDLVLDKDLNIIDVALGTSAAPIYFPAHKVGDWRIVDGGLIANDPTLVAVHEAMKYFGVRPALYGDSSTGEDDLRILAIGTLSPRHFADVSRPLDQGLFDWGAGAFELAMSAQEAMSGMMVDKHMLPGKVVRLPSLEARPESAPGLADVSDASSEILRSSAANLAQNALGQSEVRSMFQHTALTLPQIRQQIEKSK